MMRLKPTIAIMLCIIGAPSLSSANDFFGNLAEEFKTKINEFNEQVNQAKEQVNQANKQVNQANDLVNQVDGQINQTVVKFDQARQSVKDTRNFSMPSDTGFANSMDVIGLRLGMTTEEAKKALQTYDTTMQIQELYSQLPPVSNSRYLHQIRAISNTGRTGGYRIFSSTA